MSRRHRRNAKARHHGEDIPMLVESQMRAREQQPDGRSYEEARWPFLSPRFRAAHNRLRQSRGLPSIPEPTIDRYIPPPRTLKPWDPSDKEWLGAVREYDPQRIMLGRGDEGFEVKQGVGDGRRK
jgi:hypothetical protein